MLGLLGRYRAATPLFLVVVLDWFAVMSVFTEERKRDLLAGTSTAVVLIPQAMAYALVAGLPPIHGLYASVLPLMGYALVGRSRELAVGPGAIDSILVAAGLGSLAFVTSQNWVLWAAIMAGLTGAIQLALAGLRAGFLVNFLSRPVISGFTSAAAIIIALSQVRTLLGLDVPGAPTLVPLVRNLVTGFADVHLPTALVGFISIAGLLGLRRWKHRALGPLLVVAVAVALSWWLDLGANGVAVVGALPTSLPVWDVQGVTLARLWQVVPTAATVALVGYLTVISIGQTFANRRGVVLDANRELAAAGLANVLAGISQGFPVSASFSRSAVHAAAEPATPRALGVTAAWVVISLLALGPVLGPLPRATLAAVILVAVSGLIDAATPKRLWRFKPADAGLLALTFAATLLVGVEPGILIGVGASLGLLLFRTTRPHVAVLGRLGESTDYRNVRNYPEATTVPGLLVLRMDAQFYFGNVSFLRTVLSELESASEFPLRGVIFDASTMNQLDSSANDALEEVVRAFHRRGILFGLATVRMPVQQVMQRSGLYETIGEAQFFRNVHDAVTAFNARIQPE
jgi:SulP family sulfate permease